MPREAKAKGENMCELEVENRSSPLEMSARRLKVATSMLTIAMFETDIVGRLRWSNEHWSNAMKDAAPVALDLPWLNALHPDDLLRAAALWEESTSQRVRFDFEGRVVRRDQTISWMQFRGAPLLDPVSGATSYVVTAEDTTARHRLDEFVNATTTLERFAEESAAALAQKTRELGMFASLVASSTDAIAIATPTGAVHYVNAAFRKLFDLEDEKLPSDIVSALGLDEATAEQLQLAIAKGTRFRATTTLKYASKSATHADLSSFHIFDATSLAIGMAVMVRDLSQHVEAERERLRLHAEIIAAQEAAIRELSTPLLPIAPQVIAMPLIGYVNNSRGQQILDVLLSGINRHHAKMAIIDVTGVREVDNDVVSVLIRAACAAKMLGADVILTGITPLVARRFINLGTQLGGLRTLATLEQGIHAALASKRVSTPYRQQRINHPNQNHSPLLPRK